jgi:hypothetical protein
MCCSIRHQSDSFNIVNNKCMLCVAYSAHVLLLLLLLFAATAGPRHCSASHWLQLYPCKPHTMQPHSRWTLVNTDMCSCSVSATTVLASLDVCFAEHTMLHCQLRHTVAAAVQRSILMLPLHSTINSSTPLRHKLPQLERKYYNSSTPLRHQLPQLNASICPCNSLVSTYARATR